VERPLVAVVSYHLQAGRVVGWERGAFAVPEPYLEALGRAGAVPAMLAPGTSDVGGDVLASFDALILIGGGDVDPARYGADPDPSLYGLDPARDAMEIELLREADRSRIPTLAICRGVQVMNVAFGGSLLQHLPDVARLQAHGTPGGGAAAEHVVSVAESSRLFRAVKRALLTGTSHHHQGIDRVGAGLVAVAWSEDGLVEAVERDEGWMVGVQWHPEVTAHSDPAQQALFDAVVAEAGSAPSSDRRMGRQVLN
jgi:putative glutamine amidotransferase